jgi:hypothetical protein
MPDLLRQFRRFFPETVETELLFALFPVVFDRRLLLRPVSVYLVPEPLQDRVRQSLAGLM